MITETEAQASVETETLPTLPPELISPRPFDLNAARLRNEAIGKFCDEFLQRGQDYTVLENFDRPALGKSGAEKLAIFCGLEPRIMSKEEVLDWTGKDHGGEPFFYSQYRYAMFANGKVAGEGEGSCNSWEQKYRWRWVSEAMLPSMFDKATLHAKRGSMVEFEFAIDRMETTGKYGKPASHWQAFKEAIANNTARRFEKDKKNGGKDWAYEIDTTLYRIPNPDNPDIVNTVQKISQKRSFICAVIVATGVSNRFSQDVDDMPPEVFGDRKPTKTEPKKEDPPKQQSQGRQQRQQQEQSQRGPETSRTAPRPATRAKDSMSEPERIAAMEASFADLQKRAGNDAWFRRRLGYAEPGSLSLEAGGQLYKSMVEFVNAVHSIENIRQLCPPTVYERALFGASITDLWQASDISVLQGIASALQEGCEQ